MIPASEPSLDQTGAAVQSIAPGRRDVLDEPGFDE
jgi:hypothetical protein